MLSKKIFILILFLHTFIQLVQSNDQNEAASNMEVCVEKNGCNVNVVFTGITNFVETFITNIVDKVVGVVMTPYSSPSNTKNDTNPREITTTTSTPRVTDNFVNFNTTSKPDIKISPLSLQSTVEKNDKEVSFTIIGETDKSIIYELPMSNFSLKSFNKMSINFFKIVLKNEPGNFVFSPFGVSQLLTMSFFGARDKTQSELKAFLHKNNWAHYINTFIDIKIKKEGIKNLLSVQNKIYIDKKFQLNSKFTEIISKIFKSTVEQLNFKNTEEANNTINSEIRKNGISNILKTGDVENNDNLFLLNIINLEAGWELGYQTKPTLLKQFYISDRDTVEVPTMERNLNVFKTNNKALNATIVKIFHRISKPIAMFIIIPNENQGLQHIEDNLDKLNLENFDDESTKKLTNLFLPIFKLDTNIDLKKYLKKMGINQAFTTDANFTGISQMNNLFINKIIQKSTIEVNEKNNINTPSYYNHTDEIDIKVDRPFLVVIAIKKFIIFTGRVTNP